MRDLTGMWKPCSKLKEPEDTNNEEKRGLPFFNEFYLCQFPDEEVIDAKGYRRLLTMSEVQAAQVDVVTPTEEPMKMDVDVGGGDYNVYCIRQGNKASTDKVLQIEPKI